VTGAALTEGFAAAFLIAAEILLVGAFCAVRTLPARKIPGDRPIIPSG
jgi:hypothetical protein